VHVFSGLECPIYISYCLPFPTCYAGAAAIVFVLDRDVEQNHLPNQPRTKSARVACIDEHVEPEIHHISSASQSHHTTHASNEEPKGCRLSDFSLSFWLLCGSGLFIYAVSRGFVDVASGLLLERNLFIDAPDDCKLQHTNRCASGYLVPAMGNPSKNSMNNSYPESTSYISFAPPLPRSLNITGGTDWQKQTYQFDR